MNVAIDDGVRRLEDVPFPFLRQTSAVRGPYRITARIDRAPYQFAKFTLLPTLCLSSVEIDGQPVSFPQPDPTTHCDFINGYEVTLPAARQTAAPASIAFDAKVTTSFEIFGLSVRPPGDHPLVVALKLMAGAALAAALYLALRRWKLSRSVALILVGALPIQLLYLSHTPPAERTYDVLGHLQHIEFIAYQNALPPSNYCHECYQPSLYYAAAAAVYTMARAARIFDPTVVLQFFSLAWFWVFLVMSTRIALLWLPRERDVRLATASLAFWPAGFLHAPRVSNDIPLYAFFAICLYFILSWWKTGSRRHLLLAAAVAGCGILVKATMMVAAAVLGILILYRILAGGGKTRLNSRFVAETAFAVIDDPGFGKGGGAGVQPAKAASSGLLVEPAGGKSWAYYLPPMLVMAAGLACYIFQSFRRGGIFLPAWLLSPSMYVGNSWKQYLFLDTASYFRSPFVSSIRPGSGREYFWNYVLKSSMFGDYDWFHKPVERILALVMSLLLLALVVVFGIGVVRTVRRSGRELLPLLLVIALSFISLFLHRFANPYSANNDFRFIYPVLVPMVLLVTEGARNSGFGRTLCFSFCGLSAAFYLSV